ncbi:MAG: hypothetical protein E7632_09060 [Ruminococcaceae bacterium]|nr:hypothetical protein [Oscillospiraceae bacterium]
MDSNELFLQELYKNTTMGADSIVDLMDKASDPRMRAEMTAELEKYQQFSARAAELLGERGLKPEEPGMMAKAGAKIGMTFNTMLDVTTSHIAEMMINGATMGIINIEKQMNSADAAPETKKLAEDVLKFEKSTAENLSRFLK